MISTLLINTFYVHPGCIGLHTFDATIEINSLGIQPLFLHSFLEAKRKILVMTQINA